ncbi:MAG: DUF3810 family protein, partial [Candidatus Eremiobacteraeota bacterium]|nr:DUF3810 family protein [Candidatus Eremiobacteraeota bacterium]
MFVDLLLLAIAALFALVHPSLSFLDGRYANGFYPALQTVVTAWTNRVPFSVADCILVLVLLVLIAMWIRALRASRRPATLLRLVLRTAAVIAVIYIWFLVDWGWNYVRPSLAATLDYRATALNRTQLASVELRLVTALNAAAVRAHRQHDQNADISAPLFDAQRNTLELIDVRHPVVRTVPKHTLFDPYFVATGVSGMFVPFTYETYLASDLLWFEYPFTLEHEWGHVAGIARESDANFIAAVATLNSSDAVLHYSGLLIVYAAFPRIAQADAKLSPLVLEDYAAMRRRDQR